MAFNYAGLAATAVAQIADKGRAVSLVYTTPGTLNKTTDTLTPATTSTVTAKVLFKNYRKSDIDGTLVKNGDKLGLLANESVLTRAPKTGDQITDGGQTYTIKDVREIQPGDTVMLYEMQLRK